MRIPQIDFERERGEPYMLNLEKLFNPILHSCIEDTQEKVISECRCGSTDQEDYYHNNKSKCRYCVNQQVMKLRRGEVKPVRNHKRKYATCDCGITGETNFYFVTYKGQKKIQYPCKECRRQSGKANKTASLKPF